MKLICWVFLASFGFSELACQNQASSERKDSGPRASAPDPGVARPSAKTIQATSIGEPVVILGQATGYFQLDNRSVERRENLTCPTTIPRHGEECSSYRGSTNACTKDLQCQEHPRGYCTLRSLAISCACEYGCVGDKDCGSGKICVCADPVGYCAESSCGESGLCPTGACTASAPPEDVDRLGPFSCKD